MTGSQILVVDDDPTVVDVMTKYLDREGFVVASAGDGPGAVEAARRHLPDLILLDLMLPGMEGLEVLRLIRLLGPVPVVMLTANGEEEDRVTGLELGADDYVVKPFSPREVTARVKAVLNRAGTATGPSAPGEPVLRAGELVVDVNAREVCLGEEPVSLTPRELDLLVFMMRHPHVVLRREELMEAVWGWAYGDTATVTVHMRRLRAKTETHPSQPTRILTVWGVGYRFEP
ncbi:MAG: DNA-binding response regulator [Acidimicrobiales bacterium]|nr:MAG: DNA-binding response regulator [Acidimicrobiales bacterium]